MTFDLDALDSSVMSAVGTPEPGGLHWDEVSELLATVAQTQRIVGFDVTELAPQLGPAGERAARGEADVPADRSGAAGVVA